ncbi:MAG: peptidase C69 [Clostridiales bacterium]|nr:peptidase C69 [Clostridiales bacterium]
MKRKSFLVLVMIFIMSITPVLACSPIAVGKDASVDGSVMVAHTCDGWYDHRIQIIPGGEYGEDDVVEVYVDMCVDTRPNRVPQKVGEIPQAEKTNTYFHVGYPFMNDKQVVMGEHTWTGRQDVSSPQGMLYIANLEMLGLQRASTAKEAVLVMGELAEKYGYGDGGEGLLVGDPNEVWIFEVCGAGPLWSPDSGTPGAHWVAQRLPDDEMFVGANRSRIGVVDFEDKENFMYSTDLTEFPKTMGWWEEGQDFHYANIFDPPSGSSPFIASRREWRAFDLVAPSLELPILDSSSHYPFSVKPDEKLSVKDIMDIYSDHLEGTDYDLTAEVASGPFGNPNRWPLGKDQKPEGREQQAWERSLAVARCSYSFVSQSRAEMPDPVGTVLWFGEDSPDTTVYVPVYCGVTEIPQPWTQGKRHEFDRESTWWAFNLVNNWTNLRWNAIYPEVREKKASYEDEFFNNQEAIEAEAIKLYEEDPAKAVEYLTKYTYDNMEKVEQGWWDFAWHLIGKYYDGGMINEEGGMTSLGYPTEYLEEVDFGGPAIRDLEKINQE